ncbi:MAG TPA: PEGA domain-containing protein, partial [Polyangiaceae bacterium]
AKADYETGMLLYEAGDFQGALLKFQLAYDESQDPRLLWDVAVCEKALRHYARALPMIHRYLAEAAPLISVTEKQDAEDLAQVIGKFVGPIRIEANQPGATVFVDDVKVARTPAAGNIDVDMGDHKVTLRKRGFKDATGQVRVYGPGEPQLVVLRMERDMPAATLEVVAGAGQWISVDEGMVGRGRWEGMVSPGKHVIAVTGNGFKPKEVQTDLSNGGHVTMWVVAEPLEAADKTNRWPLVAILGGATVAVAVLAYYGLRSNDTPASPKVHGSLDEFTARTSALRWP